MKRKNFNILVSAVIGFLVLAVVLLLGIKFVSTAQTSEVSHTNNCGLNSTGGTEGISYINCGASYNAMGTINTNGFGTFTNYIGIIALIIILVVVLSFLGVRALGNME